MHAKFRSRARRGRRTALLLSAAAVAGAVLPGCGAGSSADGGDRPIVVGTHESLTRLDPAGTWTSGDWNVIRGVNQQLLELMPNTAVPKPDAARSCRWQGSRRTVYRCTLRDGLRFTNGHALTSADVVWSIKRMVRIADKNGPAALLDTMSSVSAPDAHTVEFRLKAPDATFPLKLTTPAAAIVDRRVYPADRLLPNDRIVGSGPYKVSSMSSTEVKFAVNSGYRGIQKAQNSGVTLKVYPSDVASTNALKAKKTDVAAEVDAGNAVTMQASKGGSGQPELYSAPAGIMQALVFDGSDKISANPAVRQAAAYLVNRDRLAEGTLKGTADPLGSLIPQGLAGHGTAFLDRYGDGGRTSAARKTLAAAGVHTPVPLTIAYPSGRPAEAAEFAELRRQLDAGGLFRIGGHTDSWQVFNDARARHKYQASLNTWLEDIPDADNFTASLLVHGGAFQTRWSNPEVDRLVPKTRATADRAAAAEDYFATIDRIAAKDAPMIPLVQNRTYMAARPGILNIDWSLDLSQTLRYWSFKRGLG